MATERITIAMSPEMYTILTRGYENRSKYIEQLLRKQREAILSAVSAIKSAEVEPKRILAAVRGSMNEGLNEDLWEAVETLGFEYLNGNLEIIDYLDP